MRTLHYLTGEDIADPDLEHGFLVESTTIKKDVTPIDDIKKFAWDDDDFEKCYIWYSNDALPSNDETTDSTLSIDEMRNVITEQNKIIAEHDDILIAMYEHLIGE